MQRPVEGDADFSMVVQVKTEIAICCLESALTMAPNGSRRLENQGYMTLNLLLPHIGQGSPTEH